MRWSSRPTGGFADGVRDAGYERDVHLVGGPRAIEPLRALGALDKLGLIGLPIVVGEGMQLTPSLSSDADLKLGSQDELDGGAVELTYVFG